MVTTGLLRFFLFSTKESYLLAKNFLWISSSPSLSPVFIAKYVEKDTKVLIVNMITKEKDIAKYVLLVKPEITFFDINNILFIFLLFKTFNLEKLILFFEKANNLIKIIINR